MSVINKKNLIILFVITLVIVIAIVMLQSINDDSVQQIVSQNMATLQGSNRVETNNTKDNNTESNTTNIEKDEEITIYNSSNELNQIKGSGWNFHKLDIDGEYESDGTYYHYNGFTITRYQNTIINVVFNLDYKDEIVEGIHVGMELDEVEKILGKPTFENSDTNMIGYATQTLYICIYEDEIAVYPNEYYSNKKLEEMIYKYYNNEYVGTANDFTNYIRKNFEDFRFTTDENKNIILTAKSRGIVIKLEDTIKVELYKNYDNYNILKNNMLDNIEYKNQYMAEAIEIERKLEQ